MTLAPGATIGILGGGQLGRMTALAAARLGYRCHIFAPEADSPAAEVAAAFTCAPYGDEAALDRFACAVDVVTLEFENVPREAVARLARQVPTRPSAEVLAVTQDRLMEKQLVRELGLGVTRFLPIERPDDIAPAAHELGLPLVLKTRRLGYDGKGQFVLRAGTDVDAAWRALGGAPAIAEAMVDFESELSVIVARWPDGTTRSYVPVTNRHREGILRRTLAPALVPPAARAEALVTAERIAVALAVEGLLAVEMFACRDGSLLVNELAPRPHNSGHWTIDACHCSQFEQLVRAICALPPGPTARFADAVMDNLIGDEVESWREYLAEPGCRLHLYGKREVRPGRKMGHVTRLLPLGGE